MTMRVVTTVTLWVLMLCGPVLAEKPADACRRVLNRNFEAVCNESVKDLLATIAPSAPADAVAEFAAEARTLFAETDVHTSLADYEFLGVRGPFAAARVVQHTITDGDSSYYRSHSMLLPQYPKVQYIQIFRKERGKWYMWTSEQETPAGNCAECAVDNHSCRTETLSVFR